MALLPYWWRALRASFSRVIHDQGRTGPAAVHVCASGAPPPPACMLVCCVRRGGTRMDAAWIVRGIAQWRCHLLLFLRGGGPSVLLLRCVFPVVHPACGSSRVRSACLSPPRRVNGTAALLVACTVAGCVVGGTCPCVCCLVCRVLRPVAASAMCGCWLALLVVAVVRVCIRHQQPCIPVAASSQGAWTISIAPSPLYPRLPGALPLECRGGRQPALQPALPCGVWCTTIGRHRGALFPGGLAPRPSGA